MLYIWTLVPYINTVGASMLTSTHVLYKGLEYIQHLLCVCRCAGPHCTLGFGSWSGHEQLIWTWTPSCCAFKHMYMQCLIESNRYRPWRLVASMWYTVLSIYCTCVTIRDNFNTDNPHKSSAPSNYASSSRHDVETVRIPELRISPHTPQNQRIFCVKSENSWFNCSGFQCSYMSHTV